MAKQAKSKRRAKPVRSKEPKYPFPPIEFIQDLHRKTEPRSFWVVENSGNYEADIEQGCEFALQLLERLKDPLNVDICLLQWAMTEMGERGKPARGILVGFFETISLALAAFVQQPCRVEQFALWMKQRRQADAAALARLA